MLLIAVVFSDSLSGSRSRRKGACSNATALPFSGRISSPAQMFQAYFENPVSIFPDCLLTLGFFWQKI